MVDARRHIKNRHDDTAIYSGTDPERNRKAGRMRDRGMLRSSHAASLVNFSYKKDYDLGDIVTVRKKAWGIEMDKRITEIQEIYENGGFPLSRRSGISGR